ncbi:hypothetical protein Hanom_Chr15g01413081 [Helianthus anomalus]
MWSKSSHRRNSLTPISKKNGRSLKTKICDEAEQERVASQKKEQKYLQRIAKLEKFFEEKIAESKASELLAEEVSADCKWLLARAVPLISERIVNSDELANYMFELGQAAYNSGRRKDGYGEGRVVVDKLSRRANAIEVLKKLLVTWELMVVRVPVTRIDGF